MEQIKLFEKIVEIINKHNFRPIELPSGYDNIYQFKDKNSQDATYYYNIDKNDNYFLEKYSNYIPNGWYGFSIGTPIIPEWLNIIDDVLDICIKIDPKFEIHQIKLKFGGICFYVYSEIIEDIDDIENLISNTLFDKSLIY